MKGAVMAKPVPPPLPNEPGQSEDCLIRESGFVIHSRPANSAARWRRGRVVLLHLEALKVALRERREKLKQLER
jgi:hypothetical protein